MTTITSKLQSKFFDLWPAPSPPPFPTSPSRLAGSTPEATQKLRELLKLNHDNWHIFYDDVGRHDHMTHHLLALWSLGADAQILQAGYDLHVELQRPLGGEQAEGITQENFLDHLGDRTYYKAYMDFFTDVVHEKGAVSALEEYVFTTKMNFGSTNKEGKHPEMLNRFISGVLHAIIHMGYGAEFGVPGMSVEGLAQIAVNPASNGTLVPRSLFTESNGINGSHQTHDTHAFTVLARILKDQRFEVKFGSFMTIYQEVMASCGDACVEYAKDWLSDQHPSPDLVQQKIQELEWMLTMMCVVPGFEEGKEYNADFIAMHFVTSSIFLQSLVPSLSPQSQVLLLRTFFSACIAWWTMLGRPELDLETFFTKTTASPNFEGRIPSPSEFALASSSHPAVTINPNPWLHIIQQAIVHPDDHVSKFQRAMYHYAARHGSTHPGYFANTELPGANKIDGTLFVRGAALAAQRLAREVDELPKEMTFWDRRTFHRGITENIY
ncbi:hypothetical protein Moror_10886 [Moniliophthora roreri MCA 2997]|uniref:Oxidoreductase AflY n=1 Tax=Moniliophthora roreri (strain MCA 2997) TaxID=1381753 RepID=V2X638_MONRO|nr:hypothetical protein Moror_10886 [Moniliophthora roreri MCA 2997]